MDVEVILVLHTSAQESDDKEIEDVSFRLRSVLGCSEHGKEEELRDYYVFF